MDITSYDVTLRHDAGTITITTSATSADDAAKLVCDAEMAPRSAVLSVTQTP